MDCPRCKAKNPAYAIRCLKCGAELRPAPGGHPRPPQTSTAAVLALVLGLLAFTCFWILTGVPAVILGLVARRRIRRSEGRLSGEGLAIAGIVLGAASAVFSLFPGLVLLSYPNFREAQTRAKVSRVRADMRSLATAIEAYYVDNSTYPPWGALDDGPGGTETYNFRVARERGQSTEPAGWPTFLLNGPAPDQKFHTLTTPIAYIMELPPDPFAPIENATFVYWSIRPGQPDPSGKIVGEDSPVDGGGWILVSPGPDGDYDIPSDWDVYDPSVSQPSPRLLAGTNRKGSAFTFDPTNGTVSNGDVWRVKQ